MNGTKTQEKKYQYQTDVVSTVFGDGMVVTAGDLDTAMQYPVKLMQTLVRAYFGCGIVCGLEMESLRRGSTSTNDDQSSNESAPCPDDDKKAFLLRIAPGVALDCHGHPLRLCKSVDIDVRPDPCAGEQPPCVCIAIGRDSIPEGARNDGDECGETSQQCQHRRAREAVRIKLFSPDKPLQNLCAQPRKVGCPEHEDCGAGDPAGEEKDPCECMKECSDCTCCGDAWVLLGCVELDECGVKQVHTCGRKYIKPIECHCRKEPAAPNGDETEPATDDVVQPAPTRRPRGRGRANS